MERPQTRGEVLVPAGSDPRRALSVVIPAYDEGDHIAVEIDAIRRVLEATDWRFEIVVVDDGSADETAARATEAGAVVLRHRRNRGYGAALKTGIRATTADWVLIIDSDGTYPAESIPELLAKTGDSDMVVGARTSKVNNTPWVRRPAKWFLRRLSGYLSGQRIPDLNSGMRLMRRSLVERYESLLPSGFSFTTTITLAASCNDHEIEFVPIPYQKRLGRSSIRPWHAYEFLMLVLRTVIFFNPLRVFMPIGMLLALAGLAKLVYDIALRNVSESAIFALLAALIVWAVGLLADQNSRIAMSR